MNRFHMRRPLRCVFSFTLCFLLFFPMIAASADEPSTATFQPPFFAFQTGFANAESKNPSYVCELVKKAGFDGVELMGVSGVNAFVPELTARGLKLHSLYLKVDLDSEQPYDAKLPALLRQHRGKLHYLWFHIHSRKFAKSDPAGDERCAEVLRELSDLAKPFDVEIGIYMHVGLWAEKFSDGVRIARKVNRSNVGAVFNLCHYLKTVGPQDLEKELSDAFPHVMLVSINGADDGQTQTMGWDRLIQPLDKGTFDVRRILRVLKKHRYAGPIGLQGYAVKEKPEEFFPRSVAAYRTMLDEINR